MKPGKEWVETVKKPNGLLDLDRIRNALKADIRLFTQKLSDRLQKRADEKGEESGRLCAERQLSLPFSVEDYVMRRLEAWALDKTRFDPEAHKLITEQLQENLERRLTDMGATPSEIEKYFSRMHNMLLDPLIPFTGK